jgi:hypothetical protein
MTVIFIFIAVKIWKVNVMNNALESIGKEAVVVRFKALSRRFPRDAEENHEELQDSRSVSPDFNLGPPVCEVGVVVTRPRSLVHFCRELAMI